MSEINAPIITKPIVGGDLNVWGAKINVNYENQKAFYDDIVNAINYIKDTVDTTPAELQALLDQGAIMIVTLDQKILDAGVLVNQLTTLINDGTLLKDALEPLVAEGTALKEELEVLIPQGDIYYKLDSRLVYAFEPAKRNIENLKYGMYVKNPLTNGDGTIRGEDPYSMAGVFDDKDGRFYCGGGYENYNKLRESQNTNGITITLEVVDSITYKMKFSGTGAGGTSFPSLSSVINPTGVLPYFAMYEYERFGKTISFTASSNGGSPPSVIQGTITDIDGIYTNFGGEYNYTNDFMGYIFFSKSGDSETYDPNLDYIIIKKPIISFDTNNKIPFIKDTAHDGKLIIKEGWTSSTHSFIVIGTKKVASLSPSGNITPLNFNSETQSNRLNVIGNDKLNQRTITVLSDNFTRTKFEDGTVRNGILTGGVSKDLFWGIHPSQAISLSSLDEIEIILIYIGDLTEQEFDSEIEKIESGKLYIPNAGVYEPVQGAKKRANEYGQTKDYVMLESQSTDIQLVETNKIVYTEDYTGVKRRDRIDGSGVITGDGGIENVGGYIRLTIATNPSASTPVKVVIENVE